MPLAMVAGSAAAAASDPPRVRLREITPEDLDLLRRWRNACAEEGLFRAQYQPLTPPEQDQWYVQAQGSDRSRITLAVESNETVPPAPALAGSVSLASIDWRCRHAEVGILLGPPWRRRGIGKAALAAICDYGFGALGLHRIWAEVFAYNEASVRLFEACDFAREGVWRDHQWWAGRWHDAWLYGRIAYAEKEGSV